MDFFLAFFAFLTDFFFGVQPQHLHIADLLEIGSPDGAFEDRAPLFPNSNASAVRVNPESADAAYFLAAHRIAFASTFRNEGWSYTFLSWPLMT